MSRHGNGCCPMPLSDLSPSPLSQTKYNTYRKRRPARHSHTDSSEIQTSTHSVVKPNTRTVVENIPNCCVSLNSRVIKTRIKIVTPPKLASAHIECLTADGAYCWFLLALSRRSSGVDLCIHITTYIIFHDYITKLFGMRSHDTIDAE